MSSTAKTVLIVAAAGVGAFVLLKVLSPSPLQSAYGKQPANTSAGIVQGLGGIASALKGIFSSDGGSPTAAPYDYYPGGAYSTTEGIVGNELANHAVYGTD